MIYKFMYKTPKGYDNIIMNSDGEYLTGLCFENSKDASKIMLSCEEKELKIFSETIDWLDLYFDGKIPDFIPKYKIKNLTPFREQIINIMNEIPYGTTITYSDIANKIAKKRKIKKMSAQAVGGAVGWNPICIIIPCHRVVGSSGNLTGYGGGMKNKVKLLELEKNDMSKFTVPKK